MQVSQLHIFATYPVPMSVLDSDGHPLRSASRDLYLLWQRAETFRVELELERDLQLQGLGTLPIEWTTYLEHQRQRILDKIRWMESREDNFTSSLGMVHDAHSTHTLPSVRGHAESRGLCPTVSPIQPQESAHPSVHPTNEGTLALSLIQCPTQRILSGNVRLPSSTTVGEGGSSSQEAHTHLDFISSTVHCHPDEHIRQSPEIDTGAPSLDHENARRDDPLGTASTRRGVAPRGVERAAYQPHGSMFNGAQSTTISGGTFFFVQGNASYMADEMLALQ
jgi:hypothetical protein